MARRFLLSVLLVCSSCTGGLGHRSMAQLQGELAVPAGVTTVRVEIGDGSLDVRAGQAKGIGYRGQVRRAADSEAELAALEGQGSALTAELDPEDPATLVVRGPVRPVGTTAGILAVESILEVPAGLAVRLLVDGSGNLAVEDRNADVEMRCGRGDIRLKRTVGKARLRTGRGNVIADDHSGAIEVEVGAGDMQIFLRQPGERARLVTGMGNVQCLVPPEAEFRLDARAETGKAANGFGFAVERQGYTAVMTGQRGSGRTEVVLRTGKGHLSLSHKTFR